MKDIQQLTLFPLETVEVKRGCSYVNDPYWDDIVGEQPLIKDASDVPQQSDTDTPPTRVGEQSHKTPVPQQSDTDTPPTRVGEQSYKTLVPQQSDTDTPPTRVGEQSYKTLVPQQSDTDTPPTRVGEQSHKTPVPQQSDTEATYTHFVEKYWVKRGSEKYYYYRYLWVEGTGNTRKLHRCYLGSVNNVLAKQRVQCVVEAIADGLSPGEIKQLIKE